jgi:hypothetical protein
MLTSCNSDKEKLKTIQKDSITTKDNITSKDSTKSKVQESTSKEVKLQSAELKKLNTFFSNFSEVFLKPFSKESITDKELIYFGVMHNERNNYKLFEKASDYKIRIKESNVNGSALKYFGREIKKHQSIEGIEYKNGYYYIPEADGEAYSFSQVQQLFDNGNDYYTVYLNIYTASSGWTGDDNGTSADWKKRGEEIPELTGKMKATILKKNGPKGEDLYNLIDYVKEK